MNYGPSRKTRLHEDGVQHEEDKMRLKKAIVDVKRREIIMIITVILIKD